MMTTVEIELLERRLMLLDELIEANAQRLKSAPPHSQQYSDSLRLELEHERNDLLSTRDITLNKLSRIRDDMSKRFRIFRRRTVDPETRAASATLDSLEAERKENILNFVKRLEQAGDHRQARIWRSELLTARESLARQYGFS
jgi:hypothetical protein